MKNLAPYLLIAALPVCVLSDNSLRETAGVVARVTRDARSSN